MATANPKGVESFNILTTITKTPSCVPKFDGIKKSIALTNWTSVSIAIASKKEIFWFKRKKIAYNSRAPKNQLDKFRNKILKKSFFVVL